MKRKRNKKKNEKRRKRRKKRREKRSRQNPNTSNTENEAASLFLIHFYTAKNALQINRYKLLQSLQEHSGRPLGEAGKCLHSVRASTTHRLTASKGSVTAPLPSRKKDQKHLSLGKGASSPSLSPASARGPEGPCIPKEFFLAPPLSTTPHRQPSLPTGTGGVETRSRLYGA